MLHGLVHRATWLVSVRTRRETALPQVGPHLGKKGFQLLRFDIPKTELAHSRGIRHKGPWFGAQQRGDDRGMLPTVVVLADLTDSEVQAWPQCVE